MSRPFLSTLLEKRDSYTDRIGRHIVFKRFRAMSTKEPSPWTPEIPLADRSVKWKEEATFLAAGEFFLLFARRLFQPVVERESERRMGSNLSKSFLKCPFLSPLFSRTQRQIEKERLTLPPAGRGQSRPWLEGATNEKRPLGWMDGKNDSASQKIQRISGDNFADFLKTA